MLIPPTLRKVLVAKSITAGKYLGAATILGYACLKAISFKFNEYLDAYHEDLSSNELYRVVYGKQLKR